ncbi:hypothetical protein FQA39_LY05984 [Lamprigera yunnana]|nr:hypothetical protein FQA39_LY05984 [Lamprigera yunnana]
MLDVVTNRIFNDVGRYDQVQQRDPLPTISDTRLFNYGGHNTKFLHKPEDELRERQLYQLKEEIPPIEDITNRPLMGLTCYSCAPISRESLLHQTTKKLGIKNILKDYPTITKYNFSARLFSHFSQCYNAKAFHYPQVSDTVLNNERVQSAVERTTLQQSYESKNDEEELRTANQSRVHKLLKAMESTMSSFLLKVTSWVLYKLLPCFLSSVVVHSGQLKMLKDAEKNGLPLIFLPLHKSHLDYIMISFVTLNNNIRCPLIAAGDNLRMPLFGSLLRRLGAFYIRRRIDPNLGQKDYIYKAILHSYMNASLRAGYNLEFFLEGGRTRTGKPLMPKYGIFSVILDALMDETIEDALLVPVSINYERLVDGNFIREQLGQPKEMETFRSAITSIWHVLNSNYGMVRIDFNQPFSLRELVKTFNNGVIKNVQASPKRIKSKPSTTSIYGTDIVSDCHKYLVEKVCKHVVYDCARSTTVMSTNAVAFLLLHKFRQGVTLTKLVAALDEFREHLKRSEKDVGFTGNSHDVVIYAVDLLGSSLVQKEKLNDEVFIKPIIVLPNVIELNYYSNTLVTYYCLEGVVALALTALSKQYGAVEKYELIKASMDICDILQYEFIFCKPCQSLEWAILDIIEDLTIFREVFIVNKRDSTSRQKSRKIADFCFTDNTKHNYIAETLEVNGSIEIQEYLAFARSILTPLIESYSTAALCMNKLVGQTITESELIRDILDEMKIQLKTGAIRYEESVSSDSVKNVFKLFLKWEILECDNEESKSRIYYLKDAHDNLDSIKNLYDRIDIYKYNVSHSR